MLHSLRDFKNPNYKILYKHFFRPNGELNSLELYLPERSIRAVEALGDLNNVENRFVAFKYLRELMWKDAS